MYLFMYICLFVCIFVYMFLYLCIFVCMCIHFCIFVYISVYSHLSSKDAPRDLLQNERLESFWGGLWLGIQPFFVFKAKSKKSMHFQWKVQKYIKNTPQYHARPFGQSRVLSILFIKAWKRRPNATGARPFGMGEYPFWESLGSLGVGKCQFFEFWTFGKFCFSNGLSFKRSFALLTETGLCFLWRYGRDDPIKSGCRGGVRENI